VSHYRYLYIGLCLLIPLNMGMRPLCTICNSRFRAVAYHKYNRVYYRSKCNFCIRRKKNLKPVLPKWQSSGYKKKTACDRCGFQARHYTQLAVYHVNGDLNDCETRNLKTICLNCIAEVVRLELPWRAGDITPDF
jgi:hypothetical protein